MPEGMEVAVVDERTKAVMYDDPICRRCPLYGECLNDSPDELCDARYQAQRRIDRAIARADGRGFWRRLLDHHFEKKKRQAEALRQRDFEETQDDVLKHFTVTEAYETVLKRILLETPEAIYDNKRMKVLEAQKTVLMNCIREYSEFDEAGGEEE